MLPVVAHYEPRVPPMQSRCRLVTLLTLFALLLSNGVLLAEEPGTIQRLPLSAGDIASVTGLNIYKFRIAMNPGAKFDVAVSVQNDAASEPRSLERHSFTSDDDTDRVDLLLSFLSRDDKLRGVLLSQEKEVVYRVDCSGCSPPGIATIISLPLNEIPGTQKTLIPMTAERSAVFSDENEVCLIAIVASKAGKPVTMTESFPRAKISIIFDK